MILRGVAMNIAISINDDYVMPAITMIESIASNNHTKLSVFIFYLKLTKDNKGKIKKYFSSSENRTYVLIEVTENKFKNFNTNHTSWTIEVLFRLFMGDYLDAEIDRILYLDSDIIINDDILGFYNQDLDNNLIAASQDNKINLLNYKTDKLGLNIYNIYVNAGVILFDFRRVHSILKLDFLSEIISKEKFKYNDQDIINIVFENSIKLVDSRYNFIVDKYRYSKAERISLVDSAKIYHYGGKFKPWHPGYTGIMRRLWWDYYGKVDYIFHYKISFRSRIYFGFLNLFKSIISKLVNSFKLISQPNGK